MKIKKPKMSEYMKTMSSAHIRGMGSKEEMPSKMMKTMERKKKKSIFSK